MARPVRIGKPAFILVAFAAIGMCVGSFFMGPEFNVSGYYGLAFPSPGEWIPNPYISWAVNTFLLGVATVLGWWLNRTFNFVRSSRPLLPVFFLILTAANPVTTSWLQSSVILCIVNIICLWILFGDYARENATQAMFTVATFLSVGAMFQYAFLPYWLFYLLVAVVMKILRMKEFCAYLLGLLAPWWIILGLGVIAPVDLHLPTPYYLFSDAESAQLIFFMLVSVGSAAFMGIACAVTDVMRIYAGNSRISAMNSVFYWLGIITLICVIFDSGNIPAYLDTLYLCVAVQIANFCALRQLHHEWVVLLSVSLLFILFYFLILF